MIVQLLTLGGLGAEQRPAAQLQVLPALVDGLVHQEILLLRAHLGGDLLDGGVSEEAQDAHCLTAHCLHGPQQRRFFVQRLAGPGTEHRGNVKCAVFDEGEGGGVPGGVAPGFKGGPQAAGGEGGGVRLAPDQLLAGELHDDPALLHRRDEAVVLFRGVAGHGLEPVGEVGGAPLDGPVLHGVGNAVGDGGVQRGAVGDALLPGGIDSGREALLHGAFVKDHAAEELRDIAGRTGSIHMMQDSFFRPIGGWD